MTDAEPTARRGASSASPHRRAPVSRRRPASTWSRVGRAVLTLLSVLCLTVTGVGWAMVSNLNDDLGNPGQLDIGEDVLDGAIDILLVGTDNRTDAQDNPLSEEELAMIRTGADDGENTDTIVLFRIPEDGSSATAISIPRDSYVETDELGKLKINGVYAAAKELVLEEAVETNPNGELTDEDHTRAVQTGRNALINTVKDLTGVEVDHYAEIGLLGFVLLTDAVGGVPVCLNYAVNEPLSGAQFDAGIQTVNGSDALSFVRQRHDLPAGDLDRIVRQQVFMAQLTKKILSTGTLTDPAKLLKLTEAARRSFVIDENWDFIDFAMSLKDISGGNVSFETIPVVSIDGVGEYGESVVLVDKDQVADFVRSLATENGLPVPTTETSTSEVVDPIVDPATVTVEVVNTTEIDGLAGSVSAVLVNEGYTGGEVWTEFGGALTSHVSAPAAGDVGAFAVSAALDGLPVQVDPALAPGTVRVVLADDYVGPTADVVDPALDESSDTWQSPQVVDPLPPSIAERPTFDAGDGSVPCVN